MPKNGRGQQHISQSYDKSELSQKKTPLSQLSNYVSNSKVTVLSKHSDKKDLMVRARQQPRRKVLQESHTNNISSIEQEKHHSRDSYTGHFLASKNPKMTKKSLPWDQKDGDNQKRKINFYENFKLKGEKE